MLAEASLNSRVDESTASFPRRIELFFLPNEHRPEAFEGINPATVHLMARIGQKEILTNYPFEANRANTLEPGKAAEGK